MNKNDLRFIKTEKRIIAAFKDCVNEIGFDKTTVALICEKASISRNTFYAHYKDKYDILDSLIRSVTRKIENSFSKEIANEMKSNDFYNSIAWTFGRFEENHEMFELFFKCSSERYFSLIEKMFVVLPSSHMTPSVIGEKSDIKYQLAKNFNVYGSLAFINTWLTNKDKISIKEAVDMMDDLSTSPMKNYLKYLDSAK